MAKAAEESSCQIHSVKGSKMREVSQFYSQFRLLSFVMLIFLAFLSLKQSMAEYDPRVKISCFKELLVYIVFVIFNNVFCITPLRKIKFTESRFYTSMEQYTFCFTSAFIILGATASFYYYVKSGNLLFSLKYLTCTLLAMNPDRLTFVFGESYKLVKKFRFKIDTTYDADELADVEVVVGRMSDFTSSFTPKELAAVADGALSLFEKNGESITADGESVDPTNLKFILDVINSYTRFNSNSKASEEYDPISMLTTIKSDSITAIVGPINNVLAKATVCVDIETNQCVDLTDGLRKRFEHAAAMWEVEGLTVYGVMDAGLSIAGCIAVAPVFIRNATMAVSSLNDLGVSLIIRSSDAPEIAAAQGAALGCDGHTISALDYEKLDDAAKTDAANNNSVFSGFDDPLFEDVAKRLKKRALFIGHCGAGESLELTGKLEDGEDLSKTIILCRQIIARAAQSSRYQLAMNTLVVLTAFCPVFYFGLPVWQPIVPIILALFYTPIIHLVMLLPVRALSRGSPTRTTFSVSLGFFGAFAAAAAVILHLTADPNGPCFDLDTMVLEPGNSIAATVAFAVACIAHVFTIFPVAPAGSAALYEIVGGHAVVLALIVMADPIANFFGLAPLSFDRWIMTAICASIVPIGSKIMCAIDRIINQ